MHLLRDLKRESWLEAMAGWENAVLSTKEREENHTCLRPLCVVSVNGPQIILRCGENPSRFREGDRVYVNPDGTPPDEIHGGYRMEWVSYDAATGAVCLTPSFDSRRIPFPFEMGSALMVDQGLDNLQDAVSDLLSALTPASPQRKVLDEFLSGALSDRLAPHEVGIRNAVLSGWPLNEGQTTAFDQAIAHYPVSGIQGPPGTGKTRVLAALAAYYSLRGMDVLLSAVSHFAINHALNQCAAALHAAGSTGNVAKLSRIKNGGLGLPVMKLRNLRDLGERTGPHGTVVGMTPFLIPRQAPGGDFKVLLFDEAGQATLPLALVAMAHAKKTIFVGDHRQLAPITLATHHPEGQTPSAFGHLANQYPERLSMLTESYRLGPDLCSFSSQTWYGGKLVSHPDRVASPWAIPSPHLLLGHPILDPALPSVWVEVPHQYRLKYCDEEAEIVVQCLVKLKEAGVDGSAIAVLVPFRGQQNRIHWHLHKRFGRDPFLQDLLVDTVDRLQGQERDVVFYSLTMSDPLRLSRIADFFFDPGRLNVALTRARFKRVILGSPLIFEAKPPHLDGLFGLNQLARFCQNSYAHKANFIPQA